MSIQVLQNDNSIERQRQLVAAALPELESFIIIGRRYSDSDKMPNFASCSFSADDLVLAVANFLVGAPQCLPAFSRGVIAAISALDKLP